jgi:hypothetical protein
MKRFVLASGALAVAAGLALSMPSAQAASYGRHHGVTPPERAAIARSKASLDALRWRARADGHVSLWERMKINAAQARHNALVARYRYN